MARSDRKTVGTSALVLCIVMGSWCATNVSAQTSGRSYIPFGSDDDASTRSVLRSAMRGDGARVAQRSVPSLLDGDSLESNTLVESPRYGLPSDQFGQTPEDLSDPQLPKLQGFRHDYPYFDFRHGNPDDPGRHVGIGRPLEGTSWLNRPWYVGWFVGALNGDDLIDGRVDQHTGVFGGYRLGYDFDHYWGTEGRWGFTNLALTDSNGSSHDRTSRDWFWDVNLLYYPWGDATWRPYFTAGLGWGEFRFTDENGLGIKDTTIQIPIGVGMKYYYRKWLALRIDLMDNIAFSSEQVDTMHNLSVTGGVEVRLGGSRKSYYPWTSGNSPW